MTTTWPRSCKLESEEGTLRLIKPTETRPSDEAAIQNAIDLPAADWSQNHGGLLTAGEPHQAHNNDKHVSIRIGCRSFETDDTAMISAVNSSHYRERLQRPEWPISHAVNHVKVRKRAGRPSSSAKCVEVVPWHSRSMARSPSPEPIEYPNPILARQSGGRCDVFRSRNGVYAAHAFVNGVSLSSAKIVSLPSIMEQALLSVRNFMDSTEVRLLFANGSADELYYSEVIDELNIVVAALNVHQYRNANAALRRACKKMEHPKNRLPVYTLPLLYWVLNISYIGDFEQFLRPLWSLLRRNLKGALNPAIVQIARLLGTDEAPTIHLISSSNQVIVDQLEADPGVQAGLSQAYKTILCQNLINQGDYEAACSLLSKLQYEISVLPSSVPQTTELNMQLNVATMSHALKDYDTAIAIYDYVLTKSSQWGEEYDWFRGKSLYWLARCHYDLGDLSEALCQGREALSIFLNGWGDSHAHTFNAQSLVVTVERTYQHTMQLDDIPLQQGTDREKHKHGKRNVTLMVLLGRKPMPLVNALPSALTTASTYCTSFSYMSPHHYLPGLLTASSNTRHRPPH